MTIPRVLIVVLIVLVGSSLVMNAQTDGTTGWTEPVRGNNAFAFDLYRALRGGADNLILSPYSVSQALAMTYAGARGETAQQIAYTLHFTLPQAELHPAFGALDRALPVHSDAFRLNTVNAFWGQEGYAFLPEYIDLLDANYGAGVHWLDFAADPDAARQTINQWVEDETEDRIQDLLKPGTITPITSLVLTNAIYFNAAWAFPFNERMTGDADFTLLDGSRVTAPMMHLDEPLAYTAGSGYRAVRLPYRGEEVAMLVLLPDAGTFEAFEDALDAEQFDQILGALEVTDLGLSMPRFEHETAFDLAEILPGMGMPLAFSSDADFSGMTGGRELAISAVPHKAFVKVDESGTEAAAATAVVIKRGLHTPAVEVKLNRPFIYLIYDEAGGTILFMGRVLNPANGS